MTVKTESWLSNNNIYIYVISNFNQSELRVALSVFRRNPKIFLCLIAVNVIHLHDLVEFIILYFTKNCKVFICDSKFLFKKKTSMILY